MINVKLMRNDYTFIKRLKVIENRYMKLSYKYEDSDTKSGRYYRLHLLFSKAINDVKEEMILKSMQKINDRGAWKKEYDCIFTK